MDQDENKSGECRRLIAWRPLFLIAAVPLFLASIPYLGVDLAIFFSVVAGLWLFGERRVLFALSLALGVTAALCLAYGLGLQPIG